MNQFEDDRMAPKTIQAPSRMVCVVLSFILLLSGGRTAASPMCDVRYQFLGYTKESSDIFWIAAQRGGECYGATLLSHSVTDTNCTVQPTWLPYETNFLPVQAALSAFKHGTYFEHGVIQSRIVFSDSCSISTTKRLTSMVDSLERLYQATQVMWAKQWNTSHGLSGIEIPKCDGCSLQLLAYDVNGLYVDYEFDRVFTFQPDPYVLIFTRQKRIADGLDQMHGYLLFRVVR